MAILEYFKLMFTCNSSFSMTKWTNSSFNFSILEWKSLTITWIVAVFRFDRDSWLNFPLTINNLSKALFPINCFNEFTSLFLCSSFCSRNLRLPILWQFPSANVASDCKCPRLLHWFESSWWDSEISDSVSLFLSVLKASQSVWDLFNLEDCGLSPFSKGFLLWSCEDYKIKKKICIIQNGSFIFSL